MLARHPALALLLAAALPAQAARPFITDDARLTTAGSCQLESWMRSESGSTEFWALPACNPWGNLEFTAGMGTARMEGRPDTHDHLYQLKTLFKPLETNGWGWGLGVGTVRHPGVNPGPNLLGNVYAYVPMSFSLHDDRVVVHANLGWLRDRASREHNLTWGLGGEIRLSDRVLGIVETYGDHRHRPLFQIGARFALVPDRIQFDATVGERVNGPHSSRWISFGVRLTPDRLF